MDRIKIYSKEHPEFITVTCLDWKPLLEEDNHKDIIANSLDFLSNEGRAAIYAFVIMNNHFHLIWHIMGEHKRDEVQRDFLKFTGQQILKSLRSASSTLLQEIIVNARDRKHQVWERNSLSIPLWSDRVFNEKLEYIHYNPVKAGLCQYPEDYKYSSARFYELNENNWRLLTHYNG
jgi:REP element-mobilizing transposase RayT